MATLTIRIDPRLNETTALQLAADIAQVDTVEDSGVELDFSNVTHFEPFAMLMTGSTVRRLRHRREQVGTKVKIGLPVDADTGIAGPMGFW